MKWHDLVAEELDAIPQNMIDPVLRNKLNQCITDSMLMSKILADERRKAWDTYAAANAGYGSESAARRADEMLDERDARWKKPHDE